MIPSHERLVAEDLSVHEVHDRLVMQAEIPVGDRLPQHHLGVEAPDRVGAHRLGEDRRAGPTLALGAIHRGFRACDE